MPRFYIGPSPSGHALRIMKNAADDPEITPRTDYEKFIFDSESGNLAYTHSISDTIPNINALGYPPVVSSMVRYEADWWDLYGSAISRNAGHSSHETCHAADVSKIGASAPTTVSMYAGAAGGDLGSYPSVAQQRILVWQLPANNQPMVFPSSVGTAGGFYRNGSAVRLPRVGFSVADTDPKNFILHENLRPAKIVKSGLLEIPAGNTVDAQLEGVSDGASLFVGGAMGQPDQALMMPQIMAGTFTSSYRRVQVRFMGDGLLRFREKNGRAAFVTYYVVAEDGSGYSTGDGSFIRSFGEGEDAYVQIRRPGCAEPPNLSDVLLDSRWPAMPILKEGFVPKSSFSTTSPRVATVMFDADLGYRPIVLAMWNFSLAAGTQSLYRQGLAGYFQRNMPGTPFFLTGYTMFTLIDTDRIEFRHLMGATPLGWGPTGNPIDSSGMESIFTGVRYYVFGVPQD